MTLEHFFLEPESPETSAEADAFCQNDDSRGAMPALPWVSIHLASQYNGQKGQSLRCAVAFIIALSQFLLPHGCL